MTSDRITARRSVLAARRVAERNRTQRFAQGCLGALVGGAHPLRARFLLNDRRAFLVAGGAAL